MNAAQVAEDRYEDYIVNDIPADVESHYPVAKNRESRAIGGLSMGGYGAFYLALKHPDRYWFVGSMSNAVDAPTRGFLSSDSANTGDYAKSSALGQRRSVTLTIRFTSLSLFRIRKACLTSTRPAGAETACSVRTAYLIARWHLRTSTTFTAKLPEPKLALLGSGTQNHVRSHGQGDSRKSVGSYCFPSVPSTACISFVDVASSKLSVITSNPSF